LLNGTDYSSWHQDTPNHDVDYCLWSASKARLSRQHHHNPHHPSSLTAPPAAAPAPAAGAPPAAPAGDPPKDEAGGKDEKAEGGEEGSETIEYTLENGKVIQLSADSRDACDESCKNAPEMKDDGEKSAAQAAMDMGSGGEQGMLAGCMMFCKTEFEIQCFPATSTVVVKDRGSIPLSDLRLGDLVLVTYRRDSWHGSGTASEWAIRFEPVISWLHRDPDRKMEVIQVRHTQGEVSLTLDHLIFSRKADSNSFEAVLAREVCVGDRVLSPWVDGTLVEPEVLSVTRSIAVGAYTPLMPSGSLLVDGTLVSCYTVPNDLKSSPNYATLVRVLKGLTGKESDHDLAHMAMLPLRIFHNTAAQWRMQFGELDAKQEIKRLNVDHGTNGKVIAPLDKSMEDHVHPWGLFLYVACKSLIY